MSDRWRGVVAALLNSDLRAALAEMPQVPLTDARRARAIARLEQLGLIRADAADGAHVFDEASLRSILAEAPVVRREGPERYLDGAGRIDRYPLRDADRRELLAWVAAQALQPGEVLTERHLNERLEPFTADVAVLRRYLVDAELLERTRSGSEYALVAD